MVPVTGTFSLDESCQAEIREVRFTIGIYQDVPRLNISMQNSSLMCVMNSSRELDNEFHCAVEATTGRI